MVNPCLLHRLLWKWKQTDFYKCRVQLIPFIYHLRGTNNREDSHLTTTFTLLQLPFLLKATLWSSFIHTNVSLLLHLTIFLFRLTLITLKYAFYGVLVFLWSFPHDSELVFPANTKLRKNKKRKWCPSCIRNPIKYGHTSAKKDIGSFRNEWRRANATEKAYRRSARDWNWGFGCKRHRAVALIIWTSHISHQPRSVLLLATEVGIVAPECVTWKREEVIHVRNY